LAYLFGAEKTIDMTRGSEGHERLVEDFQKVNLEEIWGAIYSKGWKWIGEMPLISIYKNTPIFGRLDQILFTGGNPRMLFEFKFSRHRDTFPSQQHQAQTYCIELHELGFDTSFLFYAIVISPPEKIKDMEELKKLPKVIFQTFLKDQLFLKEESSLTYGDVEVYIFAFKLEQAQKDLDYAIEYWYEKRTPMPSDNINKCRSCEFKEKCELSLIKN